MTRLSKRLRQERTWKSYRPRKANTKESLCYKRALVKREKGDSPHLCAAPSGPFRQMGTVPFFPIKPGEEISTLRGPGRVDVLPQRLRFGNVTWPVGKRMRQAGISHRTGDNLPQHARH